MRRTKIIATLGPATSHPETLGKLFAAGADVVRVNFSHGNADDRAKLVRMVREVAARSGKYVAVLADLQGPKIRIQRFRDGEVQLAEGQAFILDCELDAGAGTVESVGVAYPQLATDVVPGDVLLLDDGFITLSVERVTGKQIHTRVTQGGRLADKKGINRQGGGLSAPALTEKDREDLRQAAALGVDWLAVSFVCRAGDMQEARALLREAGGTARIVAKIERAEAIANLESIIDASDAVMVARGDLAVEMGIEEVPMIQKRLLALAGSLARPSITATQMLDSMVTSSRPTRAEVADVANAILDGTDAVMLSQETAVGAHPVLAIEIMAAVALTTEREAPYERWSQMRVRRDERDPAYTVAYNACVAARDLRLSALVIPTLSGRSARLVSAHRPDVPIYALSPGRETVRRCGLMWGVRAESMRRHEVTEALIADAARRVVELGWCKPGQRIGITAGLPSGRPGTTSLFQIQEL